MSSTTCNEFIEILAAKVVAVIVSELKEAKYYSIIVDSTPDLSHVDQLTIVVRYVSNVEPFQRFLGFVPIHAHTGEHMENVVYSTLTKHDIDIMNCRGQSYDNASNISGRYNGLQARICATNPLTDYIPCSAHSLNLVGTCTAEACSTVVTFFSFVQNLYTFFSSSTHRWVLTKHLDTAILP